MSVVVTAVLAGAAVALALPAPCGPRLAALLAERPAALPTAAEPGEHAGTAAQSAPVLLASLLAGLGVGLLVGGSFGILLGVGTAVTAVVVLRRLEPRAVRRRREQVAADLPAAVDLLGACLLAGRPPTESLAAVGAAVGGPLARDLQVVGVRLRLGADPVSLWRDVGRQPGALAALGRTMARSLETGAPMAESLHLLAADLRRRRRAEVDQRARAIGVRAAAPLGLCFLPAFVLVGIVPSVISAFAAMSWW